MECGQLKLAPGSVPDAPARRGEFLSFCCTPLFPFSRRFNRHDEGVPAEWQSRQRSDAPHVWRCVPSAAWKVAVGETVILLHPPLPSVGVSIVMERERQQNGILVRGLLEGLHDLARQFVTSSRLALTRRGDGE